MQSKWERSRNLLLNCVFNYKANAYYSNLKLQFLEYRMQQVTKGKKKKNVKFKKKKVKKIVTEGNKKGI